jgi:long-chain acyl-CoA synthetase
MNPLLKGARSPTTSSDSGARLLFAWHAFAAEARPGAEARPAPSRRGRSGRVPRPAGPPTPARTGRRPPADDDDTAVILYTSGTTGTAEGRRAHPRQPRPQRRGLRTDLLALGPDDVIFGGLPLFHAFGQTCGAQRRDRVRRRA